MEEGGREKSWRMVRCEAWPNGFGDGGEGRGGEKLREFVRGERKVMNGMCQNEWVFGLMKWGLISKLS